MEDRFGGRPVEPRDEADQGEVIIDSPLIHADLPNSPA